MGKKIESAWEGGAESWDCHAVSLGRGSSERRPSDQISRQLDHSGAGEWPQGVE